jgi:hypothetical protein
LVQGRNEVDCGPGLAPGTSSSALDQLQDGETVTVEMVEAPAESIGPAFPRMPQ